MNMRVSRRTLMALAGGAALGAGTVGWTSAFAQAGTSPHTFPGGQVLTWADPWTINASNQTTGILPGSVALRGGNLGEVVVGYHDSPQSIDDVATAFLTLVAGDPALAQPVAGGAGDTVGADGAVEATYAYQVYALPQDEETWGLYFELIDEVGVRIFAAPVSAFAAEMASAQASVQIDDVGIFGGADGAEFQQFLEDAALAPAGTQGGEYTDGSGFVNVAWTNGWTETERNENGITLTDPNKAVLLYISGYPFTAASWQEMADEDVAFLYDDQGVDATLVGPIVTEGEFSFITDGQYGLRFAQGTSTDNPDLYVLTFAANFAADIDPADAVALVQSAQAAVTVNGTPVLQGLESLS